MKNIYLISGLGADERVFQNLDFSNCKPNVIHWIKNKKNENLEEYCLRLSEQILDRNELILLGVSFGGIVAVELSKILKTNKIIIISSIKLAVEKPYLYQFANLIKLLNFLPSRLFTIYSSFIDFLFGVNSKQEKQLLRDFIENNDPDFIKWSIVQILKWKNNFVPLNLIHIHGEKDKLFPFKMVRNTIPIINGGHFMILNKHKEISAILKKYNIIE